MDVRDAYESFLTRDAIFQDEKMESDARANASSLSGYGSSTSKDYRMIDQKIRQLQSMSSTLTVTTAAIGQNFGQDEIVHERLEYVLNRRRGLYFDCSSDGILINYTVIQGTNGKDFCRRKGKQQKRYQGKHSLQQFYFMR